MLKINNLQFERNEQPLFAAINLELATGSCLQLCGPNGAGKTTVLKILAGLSKARRGSILWRNQKIPSLAAIAKYLGHELALKPQLSVWENLHYYANIMHANPAEINLACDFFDLASLQNRWLETLSAGQKHRCQLAKLFIGKMPIWLLDEPFTALDQAHIQQLLLLFKIFLAEGGIIIFTSHHPVSSEHFTIQQLVINPHDAL